ncbi:MAG: hypothetical protein NTW86_18710 [Candidatus Sumerlaeota bacterium]|nr:hypothetical protein [Candidatus Sumerlaeota bacterium]
MRWIVGAIVMCLKCGFSCFVGAADLPPGGVSILPKDALASLKLVGPGAAKTTKEIVPVEGQPFDQAIRVRVGETAGPNRPSRSAACK